MVKGDRVDSGGSLLAGGRRVETGPVLTGVEERRHPMPERTHKSPVVLRGGVSVSNELVLSRGDWVETAGSDWVGIRSLLTGVEEGGQLRPKRAHKSPVVLVEGGWLVWEGGGSLLTGVEDEEHPMPSRAQVSITVLGGGVLVVEGG